MHLCKFLYLSTHQRFLKRAYLFSGSACIYLSTCCVSNYQMNRRNRMAGPLLVVIFPGQYTIFWCCFAIMASEEKLLTWRRKGLFSLTYNAFGAPRPSTILYKMSSKWVLAAPPNETTQAASITSTFLSLGGSSSYSCSDFIKDPIHPCHGSCPSSRAARGAFAEAQGSQITSRTKPHHNSENQTQASSCLSTAISDWSITHIPAKPPSLLLQSAS